MEPWTIFGWILVVVVGIIALSLCAVFITALIVSIKTVDYNARTKDQKNNSKN
jgi:hypothetical protein